MATRSPAGDKDPNDARSFLSGPVFRILLGAGAGYIARRLWTFPQDSLDSKIAQLRTAPTIPISSLKLDTISVNGDLVFIQNGVVSPLPEPYREVLYTKSGEEAVLKRTVVYTNHPKEFDDVYDGFREERLSKVPFGLTAKNTYFRSKEAFVLVNNVEADQLPLVNQRATETALDPPVTLINKVTKTRERTPRDGDVDNVHVARTAVRVKKVTEESALKCGTRLDSVFGKLSVVNGVAEIEPSSGFPKECFTMSRAEIKRAVREEARADSASFKRCGFGFGLVSLGLLASGFYSYSK